MSIEFPQCSPKTAKLLHKLSGGKNANSLLSFLETAFKTISPNRGFDFFLKNNPAYDLTELLIEADLLGIVHNKTPEEIDHLMNMPLGYYLDAIIEMVVPLEVNEPDN